jgi:hypothetical protein
VRVRLTTAGAQLAAGFALEVYAELGALLAPLSDGDRQRLSELAGTFVEAQASPFAAQP